MQAKEGFGPDDVKRVFARAFRDEGTGLFTHKASKFQHPGRILGETDGIGIFVLCPPGKRVMMGLCLLDRPYLRSPAQLAPRLRPYLCCKVTEKDVVRLAPLYSQLLHELVTLRRGGWQLSMVKYQGSQPYLEVVNPLTCRSERDIYMHTWSPSRRLAKHIAALQRLDRQPHDPVAEDQSHRLQRIAETAGLALSDSMAEHRLGMLLAEKLTRSPEADIEQLVEEALHEASRA